MTTRTAPLDRTKTEHLGIVEKVVWSDPDAEKVIVALTDGLSAVGAGLEEQFTPGTKIRFLGRWDDSPKYGQQFRFSTFIPDVPASRKGQIDYLITYAPNVGRSTAERLCDQYGSEAVRFLRERPEMVAAENIMSLSAAHEASGELAKLVALERTKIDLFELFKGRGFPGKLVDACIGKWGVKAPEMVRSNPLGLLIKRLPGCGFKRCDKLHTDMKRPPAALKRQMLAGWSALRDDSSGHTWHRAEKFIEAIREAIPGVADPVPAIQLGLRCGYLRKRRDEHNHLWLAEAAKAIAEERVADRVRVLSAGVVRWPTTLPISAKDGDGLPSQHQHDTAMQALSKPFAILTGQPGTGKTHCLAFIIRYLIRHYGEGSVAVVCPTGKAAVRATQSLQRLGLPIKATTIHRKLEIGRNGHDGDGWSFQRNRDNPLTEMFVIGDEQSMSDTGLMADLLDACAGHVLLIGDVAQLPPVGHGAPLRDLIAADVAAYGELTEIRRNAGLIVEACRDIKAGVAFASADAIDLDASANLKFIETRDEAHTVEILETVLSKLTKFDPVWQTQVLVPLNKKGRLSREYVNDKLRDLLNPGAGEGPQFAPGDKIICLRNCRVGPLAPDPGRVRWNLPIEGPQHYVAISAGAEEFLANGETGRVLCRDLQWAVVRFREDQPGDELVCKIWMPRAKRGEDRSDDDSTSDNFALAYAITTHKSQGSESPCIIVLADPAAGMVAGREWWYTAISRASKLCIVIGQRSVVAKQCAKVSLEKRQTFLVQLLREAAT